MIFVTLYNQAMDTYGDKFYVYALLDPRKPGVYQFGRWKFDHLPFYIGKGHNNRKDSHVYDLRARSKKVELIKRLLKAGLRPISTVKRGNLTEGAAFTLERRLIQAIGRQDLGTGPLLNLASGGSGASGAIHSPETRARRSDAVRLAHARQNDKQRAARAAKQSATKQSWSDSKKAEVYGKRSYEWSDSSRARLSASVSAFVRSVPVAERKRWQEKATKNRSIGVVQRQQSRLAESAARLHITVAKYRDAKTKLRHRCDLCSAVWHRRPTYTMRLYPCPNHCVMPR